MTLSPSGRQTLLPLFAIAAMFLAGACDGGSDSRTPDDIAADSALAADLALANRDMLLVDSIGALRPADADDESTSGDTAIIDADLDRGTVRPLPAPRSVPAAAVPPPPAPAAVGTRPPSAATGAQPPRTATAPTPPASATRRTGAGACNSPAQVDQQNCVRATLASTDMRLNRIYRALITEMRRQEGVARGAKDPPSVQRLRVAQRAWLVYRDTECRRRGRGKEGRLWARPRVKCLGEFSVRRAKELADNFSRLTAS